MQAFALSIVDDVRHPLLILDAEMCVRAANPAFYRTFGIGEKGTEGRHLSALGGMWQIPRLRTLLESALPGGSFEDFEVRQDFSGVDRKIMRLDARRVVRDDGTPMVLLTIEDVTEKVQARG
ncbi:MAG TPA: PAS domain-containing protein [Gemmataceae bacterium]|nr:PAS domain-containing protein [Gemmataceae bacterium]